LLASCASYSPVPEELPEKPVGEVTPVEVPGEDVPPPTQPEGEDEVCQAGSIRIFAYKGLRQDNYPWLVSAVECANKVICMPSFREEVGRIAKFDYDSTGKTGKDILSLLDNSKPVTVRTYYKRVTRAVAYTYFESNELYLNTKYHPLEFSEIINSLFHEKNHTVGMSHGSNSPVGKDKSAPYLIGAISEKYAKFCM